MSICCHAVYIDESGTGSLNAKGKQNFWVSVGVCAKLEDHDGISAALMELKKKCMRLHNPEFKGTDISRNHMNDGITAQDIAKGLAEIITHFSLDVWVTSVRMRESIITSKFIASNSKHGVMAKDVARELLLERISMGAGDRHKSKTDMYQIIWDLSDSNELIDFSAVVSAYVNPYNNRHISPSVIPNILGGLSHDWAELQIADLVSNFALNYPYINTHLALY